MAVDHNTILISSQPKKIKLLLDSSAYCRFEEIFIHSGIDVIKLFLDSKNFEYFITSSATVELMNGSRDSKFIYKFENRILNDEGSFDRKAKFSNFIIEQEGKLKAIKLYGISAVDFSQILLCQNHTNLILVSNDKKLIKDATIILANRVKDVPNIIDKLYEIESKSLDIIRLKEFIDSNRKAIGSFDLNALSDN